MRALKDLLIIDLSEAWTTCLRCGKETPHQWGLPVDAMSGGIVPNWYEGEWAGIPACRECYEKHALWSEQLLAPFDAPLV
jgi:hypothetical protein